MAAQVSVPAPEKQQIALITADGALGRRVAKSLEAYGYGTLPWRWGNGMLAMLARERPDLAIIDVDMRVQRALWLVLHRLAKAPEMRGIPIMLCAAAAAPIPVCARRYPVLHKPVERSDLFHAVQAVVGPPPAPRHRGRPKGSARQGH